MDLSGLYEGNRGPIVFLGDLSLVCHHCFGGSSVRGPMRLINDLDLNTIHEEETTGKRILPPIIHLAMSIFIVVDRQSHPPFLYHTGKRRETIS